MAGVHPLAALLARRARLLRGLAKHRDAPAAAACSGSARYHLKQQLQWSTGPQPLRHACSMAWHAATVRNAHAAHLCHGPCMRWPPRACASTHKLAVDRWLTARQAPLVVKMSGWSLMNSTSSAMGASSPPFRDLSLQSLCTPPCRGHMCTTKHAACCMFFEGGVFPSAGAHYIWGMRPRPASAFLPRMCTRRVRVRAVGSPPTCSSAIAARFLCVKPSWQGMLSSACLRRGFLPGVFWREHLVVNGAASACPASPAIA